MHGPRKPCGAPATRCLPEPASTSTTLGESCSAHRHRGARGHGPHAGVDRARAERRPGDRPDAHPSWSVHGRQAWLMTSMRGAWQEGRVAASPKGAMRLGVCAADSWRCAGRTAPPQPPSERGAPAKAQPAWQPADTTSALLMLNEARCRPEGRLLGMPVRCTRRSRT